MRKKIWKNENPIENVDQVFYGLSKKKYATYCPNCKSKILFDKKPTGIMKCSVCGVPYMTAPVMR